MLVGRSLGRAVSLDRLLRTRVWIGAIAFALIGIVTMQLVLLKLNTGIGDALQRTMALQRENAALSVADSEAGSAEAIEAQARNDGMLTLAPGQLDFLRAGGAATARRAAKALRELTVSAGEAGIASAASEAGYTTSSEGETALSGSTATLEGESLEGESLEGESLAGEALEGEAATVSEDPEAEVGATAGEASEGEAAPSEEASVTSTYEGEPEAGEGGQTALAAGGGVQAGAGG